MQSHRWGPPSAFAPFAWLSHCAVVVVVVIVVVVVVACCSADAAGLYSGLLLPAYALGSYGGYSGLYSGLLPAYTGDGGACAGLGLIDRGYAGLGLLYRELRCGYAYTGWRGEYVGLGLLDPGLCGEYSGLAREPSGRVDVGLVVAMTVLCTRSMY